MGSRPISTFSRACGIVCPLLPTENVSSGPDKHYTSTKSSGVIFFVPRTAGPL